jgi:GDP-L-fucose synthase
MTFDLAGKRVFVAGHGGLLGQALIRRLTREDCEVLTVPRAELDLTRQADTEAWMTAARPDAVFLAAARQGGLIDHMDHPGEMILENLQIQTNMLAAARQAGVTKLLAVGSAAAYPPGAAQPVTEAALMTGPLESAHVPYGVAKIAGVVLADAYRRQYGCDFITAMPGNLYGPGMRFDPDRSGVAAGLLRRLQEAKAAGDAKFVVWGTGKARRELLHADDAADACVLLMKTWSGEGPVNLSPGADVTIAHLARTAAAVVGYGGELVFDAAKPEGAARRQLDGRILQGLGWRPTVALEDGLAGAYRWWRERER